MHKTIFTGYHKLNMTTGVSYLKRYLEGSCREKNKKRLKKRSNLAVYDDDVDWKYSITSTQDKNKSEVEENDPDEAPTIAGIKDDTVTKWQPVTSVGDEHKQKRKRMDSPDLSPKRKKERGANTPIRKARSSSSDLSPQREQLRGKERRRSVSPVIQGRLQTKQK